MHCMLCLLCNVSPCIPWTDNIWSRFHCSEQKYHALSMVSLERHSIPKENAGLCVGDSSEQNLFGCTSVYGQMIWEKTSVLFTDTTLVLFPCKGSQPASGSVLKLGSVLIFACYVTNLTKIWKGGKGTWYYSLYLNPTDSHFSWSEECSLATKEWSPQAASRWARP